MPSSGVYGPRMGMRNLRAICPACGGKIHTQPKGLGHFTWMNSWLLSQTGPSCQWCGVALTGKVLSTGRGQIDEREMERRRLVERLDTLGVD
jgi:hypothetical protein